MANMARPVLRGVVFDMDGTLTVPNIDFAQMYRRCGVSMKDDILTAVNSMSKSDKEKAWGVIEEMEEEGRRTLQLKRGTVELASWLKHHKIPTAVVTRNSARTLQHFTATLWRDAGLPPFSVSISRDDANVPPKPDPEALRLIASKWGVPLGPSILMVGDSPSNDIVFGKAAGASTALLDTGRRHVEAGSDEGADFCVDNLFQLSGLLWKSFEIPGRLGGELEKYPAPAPTTEAARAAAAGDLAALRAMPADALAATDESGNTPLVWAADGGHVDAVHALLATPEAAATVNVQGYLGATAVCRAARRGHLEALEALIAAPGVDLDIPNDKLQHPLHFAAFKQHPAAVAALLAAGASTMVLDRKGRTPAEDTADEGIRAAILEARAALDKEPIGQLN